MKFFRPFYSEKVFGYVYTNNAWFIKQKASFSHNFRLTKVNQRHRDFKITDKGTFATNYTEVSEKRVSKYTDYYK